MAEIIALSSRFHETIGRIWRLTREIRALEDRLEAARRHAAAEFAAEQGWAYAPPDAARFVDTRRFGALVYTQGPDSRIDLFTLARPLPGRPSRLVALVYHTLNPGGREAALVLERARNAGLQALPLGVDSWFWPGESVARLVTPSP